MSTLLIDELKTTLIQEINPEYTQLVRAVRIDLAKIGSPAGSLKVTIKDEHNNPVGSSTLVAIASISEQNYHGFIRFDLSAQLKANSSYKVVLSSQGYTFSDSNYIAWKRDYPKKGYELSTDNNNLFESAYSLEFWTI